MGKSSIQYNVPAQDVPSTVESPAEGLTPENLTSDAGITPPKVKRKYRSRMVFPKKAWEVRALEKQREKAALKKAASVKSETKPWQSNIMKPTAYRPGKKLHVPEEFKNPEYDYRFASKNQPGRVRYLISEGYEVDTEVMAKMEEKYKNKGLQHGSAIGSTYEFAEMILMRISKVVKATHDEYYRNLQDSKMSMINAGRGHGEFEKMGLPNTTYGSVKSSYEKTE